MACSAIAVAGERVDGDTILRTALRVRVCFGRKGFARLTMLESLCSSEGAISATPSMRRKSHLRAEVVLDEYCSHLGGRYRHHWPWLFFLCERETDRLTETIGRLHSMIER